MVHNPPEGFPVITPYLLYEDLDAAVDWLVGTFGLVEDVRMKGPDGRAIHAEIRHRGGVVMMGCPGPDYQNPKRRGGATQLVYDITLMPASLACCSAGATAAGSLAAMAMTFTFALIMF